MAEFLAAGAVARRLNVAVTTLRSWHQRYGLGPSGHEAGTHRRYTPEDLGRLEVMCTLVANGVPPGEAARYASRAADMLSTDANPVGANTNAAPSLDDLAAAHPDAAVRAVADAAVQFDVDRLRTTLTEVIRHRGVVRFWDEVLRPVLVQVGEDACRNDQYIGVEHVLSGQVSAVLAAQPRPGSARPARILLACAEEEQHSLPIEALAAALAGQGVPSRVLGARVPAGVLGAVIRRTSPHAVLLWSHQRATADPEQFSAVRAARRRPAVLAAAGPGWDHATLPGRIAKPVALPDALTLLTTNVRGSVAGR
jgi:DNA-binding transcriptional MerR regulator